VVDYLQLMHLGQGGVESRQQEISTISRYIKGLARELNVPVMVLSQLNRSPEGREGHRPRMSDLRESGSIEQDADLIVLLHREDYYHRGEPDYSETNTAELILAKQRNGPTGTVKLVFRAHSFAFEDEPNSDFEPEKGDSGWSDWSGRPEIVDPGANAEADCGPDQAKRAENGQNEPTEAV